VGTRAPLVRTSQGTGGVHLRPGRRHRLHPAGWRGFVHSLRLLRPRCLHLLGPRRLGGRYPSAWGGSLLVGDRHTSGPARYLTFAASAEWRWYFLKVLGLSIVPARVEYGPRVAGGDYVDTTPYVHGTPPGQYWFQAGSRLGIALNAGLIDMLVQAPTLAWSSHPFQGGEILSFQIGVKLK